MAVVPECQAVTDAMNPTETDFMIMLSTLSSLMCVDGYQIQFNDESKNVSLDSPSANFMISATEEQPVLNEIIVYTLDHENRTGQVACVFSIPGEFPLIILCIGKKYNQEVW